MMCQEIDMGVSLLVVVYCVHYASTRELFKEAAPKGQLLFFGGGEEKFRRITTEN